MVEVYDSSREQTINFYTQLQMLEDEGKDVGELKEEVWQKIVGFAKEDDKTKLEGLREKLRELTNIKREVIIGC